MHLFDLKKKICDNNDKDIMSLKMVANALHMYSVFLP